MKIKVTKRQFLLLLDNFYILTEKELELEIMVGILNYILNT